MSIEVKGLTTLYGEQNAVNAISFTAGTGEIVGFLGHKLAGTYTTMKLIPGCLVDDAGAGIVCVIYVSLHPV